MKFALLAALTGGALLLSSQALDPTELRVAYGPYVPRSSAIFSTETNLVEVGAVVRDSQNRAVAGLHKADFELFDSGHPSEIASFTAFSGVASVPESDLSPAAPMAAGTAPRTRYIAILFDDFVVQLGPLDPRKPRLGYSYLLGVVQTSGVMHLRDAAGRFLESSLRPGDRISIVSAAEGQLIPFTSDTAQFAGALAKLHGHARDPDDLKHSVLPVIDDLVKSMAKMPGDRVILLASSGMNAEMETIDVGWSHFREQDIINHALAAGVVIHALDGKGLYTGMENAASGPGQPRSPARPGSTGSGKEVLDTSNLPLATIAYGTGGEFFHNNNDLFRGFKELVEPDTRYLLGFVPGSARDGRYHPLKVKLTAPNHYSVQARPGYIAPSVRDDAALSTRAVIDHEVQATVPRSNLPATFSTRPGATGSTSSVTSVVHLDLHKLHFDRREDRDIQRLTFIAALWDSSGNLVAGKEGVLDFALKPTSVSQILADGLNCTITLEAPPGSYRLRTVLRDDLDGKLSSSTQTVELK